MSQFRYRRGKVEHERRVKSIPQWAKSQFRYRRGKVEHC